MDPKIQDTKSSSSNPYSFPARGHQATYRTDKGGFGFTTVSYTPDAQNTTDTNIEKIYVKTRNLIKIFSRSYLASGTRSEWWAKTKAFFTVIFSFGSIDATFLKKHLHKDDKLPHEIQPLNKAASSLKQENSSKEASESSTSSKLTSSSLNKLLSGLQQERNQPALEELTNLLNKRGAENLLDIDAPFVSSSETSYLTNSPPPKELTGEESPPPKELTGEESPLPKEPTGEESLLPEELILDDKDSEDTREKSLRDSLADAPDSSEVITSKEKVKPDGYNPDRSSFYFDSPSPEDKKL